MSNFSEYIKQDTCSKDSQKNETSNNSRSKEDLEDLIDKYSKLNPNDLFNEFLKLTYKKKQNGELKQKDIENIKSTIMPYLNDEQKRTLQKILEVVDNV